MISKKAVSYSITAAAAIERARACELAEVNAFYACVGYLDGAREEDRIWVARRGGGLLAAVRICPQPEGYILMRGLYVAQNAQRRQLGTQLARAALADAAGRVCYCIPFTHLETFYHRVGFIRIHPKHAPEKVADRLQRYLDQGLEVILMRRLPVYDC